MTERQRFLEKQLTHAEERKHGRVENYCEYDPKTGAFDQGQRRADAKNRPPLVTTEEYPVGRSRGVAKP